MVSPTDQYHRLNITIPLQLYNRIKRAQSRACPLCKQGLGRINISEVCTKAITEHLNAIGA